MGKRLHIGLRRGHVNSASVSRCMLTCVELSTTRESGTAVRRSQSSSGAAPPSDVPPDDSSTHAGWSAQVRHVVRQAVRQQRDGSKRHCGGLQLNT